MLPPSPVWIYTKTGVGISVETLAGKIEVAHDWVGIVELLSGKSGLCIASHTDCSGLDVERWRMSTVSHAEFALPAPMRQQIGPGALET